MVAIEKSCSMLRIWSKSVRSHPLRDHFLIRLLMLAETNTVVEIDPTIEKVWWIEEYSALHCTALRTFLICTTSFKSCIVLCIPPLSYTVQCYLVLSCTASVVLRCTVKCCPALSSARSSVVFQSSALLKFRSVVSIFILQSPTPSSVKCCHTEKQGKTMWVCCKRS